jgi:sulfatase maturation enzyme AslB (radical SAM superfamily)
MELLERDTGSHCRHFFVTNATLLKDRIFSRLKSLSIGLVSVSLDAATEETYTRLRRGGDWLRVVSNLQRLSELKKEKHFFFSIDMTLNRQNHFEMEKFVDMGIRLDAEPFIALVSNTFDTFKFQKKYLHFNEEQFRRISSQIETGLVKVKKKGFRDAEISLIHLKKLIVHHRHGNNRLDRYLVQSSVRKINRGMPQKLKNEIKSYMKKKNLRFFNRIK